MSYLDVAYVDCSVAGAVDAAGSVVYSEGAADGDAMRDVIVAASDGESASGDSDSYDASVAAYCPVASDVYCVAEVAAE